LASRSRNALLPGLVDTPLTRYDKRVAETISETGRPEAAHPTPQEAWDTRSDRAAQSRLASARRYFTRGGFPRCRRGGMVTGAEYEVTGGDSAKDI
jgi:hypothetical protein